jgi:hypothetical protein
MSGNPKQFNRRTLLPKDVINLVIPFSLTVTLYLFLYDKKLQTFTIPNFHYTSQDKSISAVALIPLTASFLAAALFAMRLL